jgi:hypothetical protein
MRPYSLPTLCPKTNLRISKFLRPNSVVRPDESGRPLLLHSPNLVNELLFSTLLPNTSASYSEDYRQNSLESNQ